MTYYVSFLGWIEKSTPVDDEMYAVTVRVTMLNGTQVNREEKFKFPREDGHPLVGDSIIGTASHDHETNTMELLKCTRNPEAGFPPYITTIEGVVTQTLPPFDEANHHIVFIKVDHIGDVKFKDRQVVIITNEDIKEGDTVKIKTEFKSFEKENIPGLMIGTVNNIIPIEETDFCEVVFAVDYIGNIEKNSRSSNMGSVIISDSTYRGNEQAICRDLGGFIACRILEIERVNSEPVSNKTGNEPEQ